LTGTSEALTVCWAQRDNVASKHPTDFSTQTNWLDWRYVIFKHFHREEQEEGSCLSVQFAA